jgi:hypothetical protein
MQIVLALLTVARNAVVVVGLMPGALAAWL